MSRGYQIKWQLKTFAALIGARLPQFTRALLSPCTWGAPSHSLWCGLSSSQRVTNCGPPVDLALWSVCRRLFSVHGRGDAVRWADAGCAHVPCFHLDGGGGRDEQGGAHARAAVCLQAAALPRRGAARARERQISRRWRRPPAVSEASQSPRIGLARAAGFYVHSVAWHACFCSAFARWVPVVRAFAFLRRRARRRAPCPSRELAHATYIAAVDKILNPVPAKAEVAGNAAASRARTAKPV